MNATRKLSYLLLVLLVWSGAELRAAGPVLPVKVSENKRYIVDQRGDPFFWLGTTQWELFRRYDLDEARTTVERSKAHGFSFIQVMLLGVGNGIGPNIEGDRPWVMDDPMRPNEAYFKHVDAVVRMARDQDLVLTVVFYHQTYRKHLTLENTRAWAKWVGQRYANEPNIVWSLVPEAREEFLPILRELAAGVREGDEGRHLITVHPDPSPYSSSFLQAEEWLDFNSIQTWKDVKLIYPMVTKDYNLKPIKPVLMAEGAYEAGSEYGFEVTPLWVRRQAYYSYLAGGHHAYGHNDSWRVLPSWRKALDAPGAQQMGILERVFLGRKDWWLLVPDQSVFASGGVTEGEILHLAARHPDGKWLLVYLADKAAFAVNMSKLSAAKVNVLWINPKTGDSVSEPQVSNSGVKSFVTPNGWEDAVLVLETVDGSSLKPD